MGSMYKSTSADRLSLCPDPRASQPSRYAAVRDISRVVPTPKPSAPWLSSQPMTAFPGSKGWHRPTTPGKSFGIQSFAASTGLMTPTMTFSQKFERPPGLATYDGAAGSPSPMLRNYPTNS